MATNFQTLIIAIKTGNYYEVADLIVEHYTKDQWHQLIDAVSKLHLYDSSYKKISQIVIGNIPAEYPIPMAYFAIQSFRGVLFNSLTEHKLLAFAIAMFGNPSNVNQLPEWLTMNDGVFNSNLYVEIFHEVISSAVSRKMVHVVRVCLSAIAESQVLTNVVLSYYYTSIADPELFTPLIVVYFRKYDTHYKDNYLSKARAAAVNAIMNNVA